VTGRTPSTVLILAHDVGLYGAQHSLLDLIRHFDPSRYRLLVAAPRPGPFTEALQRLGVHCFTGWVRCWIHPPRHIPIGGALLKPWRLLRLRWHPYWKTCVSLIGLPLRLAVLCLVVRRHGVRLVYTNTVTLLEGALLSRLCRIPHVWHLRESVSGNLDLDNPFPDHWIPGLILRCSDAVITNSAALRTQVFGEHPPPRLHVVHNGIDAARFAIDPAPLRFPQAPQGVRFVGICGAIQERKDVLTFVRAAERVHRHLPDCHFVIVGKLQGDYYRRVAQEITERGLTAFVHCIGYREDMPQVFAGIDILVSAAVSEPFGRTIIEAMAAGKPVVSTRSGGPEEIIRDGVDGYLVPVGDDAAMAARLEQLLGDDDLYARMRAAARQNVQQRFDLQDCVRQVEAVFDAALKR